MRITGVEQAKAHDALSLSEGAVKPAILIAAGATPAEAGALLGRTGGNLRAALTMIGAATPATN